MGKLREAVKASGGESAGTPAVPTPAPIPHITGKTTATADAPGTAEETRDRELRRMVARAIALDAHLHQELEALRGYLRHPLVVAELEAGLRRLAGAIKSTTVVA